MVTHRWGRNKMETGMKQDFSECTLFYIFFILEQWKILYIIMKQNQVENAVLKHGK